MPCGLLGVESAEPRGRAVASEPATAASRVASVTWKTLPLPGTPSLSAHIVPPIASARRFEIARPRPVPPYVG